MSVWEEQIKAHWSERPCGGCGCVYPETCIYIRDHRCAYREGTLTLAANIKVAIAERETVYLRVQARKQDASRLRESLAREDAYIGSLEAALEEARNRRVKVREEYAARVSDFEKDLGNAASAMKKCAHLLEEWNKVLMTRGLHHSRQVTNSVLEDYDQPQENKENLGPRRQVCSVPPTNLASEDNRPRGNGWAHMVRERTTKDHFVASWVSATLDAQSELDRGVDDNGSGQTLSLARRPRREKTRGQRHRYRPYDSRS
ncbi:hypothetical protein BDP55DRAFT_687754 [Colletotrichum godetiae]|uniref:Uncharacterized protein n=1 Tax=Colletotrichum godetiae TaxID=1209918 RepID=A0AAJ0A858_9PEZI|nr:uncharacterized protein BDP55DRAFT_687754 [Colletotrichum godetiae]KAK1656831.1 hypothetical protein BDP55DRAFT_687754 [Colletotrichum godetiae]